MAVRVAFCITELDPGGAERALFEIVTRINRLDWEVRVYCLGPETDFAQRLRDQGIETVCLGARRAYHVGVLCSLVKQLREFQPELLQTFLFHANMIGRLAGWWTGVPVILSGLRVAERAKGWHLWIDRWTNRLVNLNVCVSEGVRKFSIQNGHLREDKLRVIPNGVDIERYATALPADLSRWGIPEGAWTLVSVGRLTYQKGHDDLLRAVAPLLHEDPQIHLLIVGEGPERAFVSDLARQLAIEKQVHLPGWEADIAGILRSSQAFVLPSRWEGMPNALLEALAAGLPCIATDVEGVRELLPEGAAGNLVPAGDVRAMRSAVERMRHQMLGAAQSGTPYAVLENHTWQAVCEKYESLFSECLRREAEADV